MLGEHHPNTLSSRNNLASAYQAAGDLGRAIPLYEQTLTDSERVLGEDHPLLSVESPSSKRPRYRSVPFRLQGSSARLPTTSRPM